MQEEVLNLIKKHRETRELLEEVRREQLQVRIELDLAKRELCKCLGEARAIASVFEHMREQCCCGVVK